MSTQDKLDIAIKALQFYADQSVYARPDWYREIKDGPLQLESCEECSNVASDALAEINE